MRFVGTQRFQRLHRVMSPWPMSPISTAQAGMFTGTELLETTPRFGHVYEFKPALGENDGYFIGLLYFAILL